MFSVLYPPSFISTPDSLEAKKGGRFELSCRAKGNPIPDIVWYKNNEAILPSDHCNLKTKQNTKNLESDASFSVAQCDLDDEATYMVEASNKAGQVTHTFDITGQKKTKNDSLYSYHVIETKIAETYNMKPCLLHSLIVVLQ